MKQFSGISNIKDIAQLHTVISRRKQCDAARSAPNVPVHGVIPDLIAGTGRSFRPLGVDQQLIIERIFIKPCRVPKKLHPGFRILRNTGGSLISHFHIGLYLTGHVNPPFQSVPVPVRD